jgi:hypothetical protein
MWYQKKHEISLKKINGVGGKDVPLYEIMNSLAIVISLYFLLDLRVH